MPFRIQGLAPSLFVHLIGRSDAALSDLGVQRRTVDTKPGAPCRITLADAEIGESVLLLSHRRLDARTPYAQSGPIFIREAAKTAFDAIGVVAPMLAVRTLSVGAFSAGGDMLDADLSDGAALPGLIARLFANPDVGFAQVHFAKRGCFAATINRV